MSKIALPKKIFFTPSEEPNRGSVTIEPLAPGYGTTLGNALRRVLLASLSGTAVVGAKIEGASHEFMAIPNVQEDVLEIMLNLKKVRFKFDDGVEDAHLTLSVVGEKEVTAADIEKQAGIQIVNPKLVLAHITDMSGKLNIDIFVHRGLGYETIETRETGKKELGYIEIDSIFSPVLHVGLDIENVRVGKMVNWEKVILNIETDGTISFEDAFIKVNDILIEQFSALKEVAINGEASEDEIEEVPSEEVIEEEVKNSEEISEEAVEDVKETEVKKKKLKKEKETE